MKNFIKNSLILLLFLSTIGCDKTPETDEAEDNGFFFDVVYQVVSTREDSTKAWVGTNGVMQIKITQYTETEGTFVFFYNKYKEPQFVYNLCSGGFKGNFTIPSNSNTTTNEGNGYDVMSPYTPTSGSNNSNNNDQTTIVDSNGNTVVVDLIKSYNFQLAINYRNLDPSCRQENDRNIIIYRFSNGELIMNNEYRQMLLKPVLTTDSQIQ